MQGRGARARAGALPLEGAATMKRGMVVLTGRRLPHLHHAR